MNRHNRLLLFVTFALVILASCSGVKLSEEDAKIAVDSLLAQGTNLPDNSPRPARLVLWQGLVQISEVEMHGKATIQHKDGKMNGAFIFHKTANGGWVIDKVVFKSSGFSWWKQDVFQKVE
jgi:hypothetical protein